MEIVGGACRFGLWYVHVWWDGIIVHRIRFAATGIPGEVPDLIRHYCAGHMVNLSGLDSIALHNDTVYSRIYREVQQVPYGSTSTYGEIADHVGTAPRVVGQAMARNPTPLIVPCHRILAAHGIGGFTPYVGIKEALIAMEKKGLRRAKT
ncbi:Methylated-DNA--protein-cysteine methyltransferase [uncultured archaeon]|nr:Methylated-DNA--protein-cysteine methyltransferase [uncultured archaeon]